MNVVWLMRRPVYTRQRKNWRRCRIQEAAGCPQQRLRAALCLLAVMEMLVILAGRENSFWILFRMMHVETDYQIEWVTEKKPEYADVFGIRLDTEDMEVEFYHQIEQMEKEGIILQKTEDLTGKTKIIR